MKTTFLKTTLLAAVTLMNIGAAEIENLKLNINRVKRDALVIKPNKKQKEKPALLIFFHGGNGTADQMVPMTDIDKYVDEHNLVVIMPNGLKDPEKDLQFWNDGRNETAHLGDDVLLTKRLIQVAKKKYNADTKKVFAGGISNGGLMTSRLICEQKDLFLGFVTVAASMPRDLKEVCQIEGPINLSFIIGTADFVMYEGGTIPSSKRKGLSGEVISTEKVLNKYLKASKCNKRKVTKELIDSKKRDNQSTEKSIYSKCADQSQITTFVIENGEHGYPTPRKRNNPAGVDIETTEVILNFIKDTIQRIYPPNTAPELTGPTSYEVKERRTLSFTLQANDGENDPLQFSCVGKCDYITVNKDSGLVTYKSPNIVGRKALTETFTFQVSDGELSSSTQISVTTTPSIR